MKSHEVWLPERLPEKNRFLQIRKMCSCIHIQTIPEELFNIYNDIGAGQHQAVREASPVS
jgi:hypothetical protein